MLLEYLFVMNCHYIPIPGAATLTLLLSSGYMHIPTFAQFDLLQVTNLLQMTIIYLDPKGTIREIMLAFF